MPARDFGDWLPDLDSMNPVAHLRDAQGCLPGLNSYRPLKSLNAVTDAMTARCRGITAVRDIDNAAHMYAGDATKLYELEATGWTDRSKVGGYTTATTTTRWRFATFGDRVLATNGLDAIQYIDASTAATAFADLAGSPGTAKFVSTYGEFVFLAALGSSGMAIKWSAIGNSEGWTAGVGLSDEQEFADGGNITGMATTRAALYVFQEKCIRRVYFVGGDVIMQIDKLVENIGCIEPNSLVQYGQLCFFRGEDSWYQWDFESQPKAISAKRWEKWWQENSNGDYSYSMSAAIDIKNNVMAIGFTSNEAGSDTPDRILFYDYLLGKATWAPITHEALAPSIALGVSLDDLTGNLDTDYSISFDDPYYQGGSFYFGAVNTDHKLASFAGDNVAASFEMSPAALFDGMRASIEWAKPVADTTAATVVAAAKVRPGDTISFGTQVAQQASGRCPQRGANGFYHAAQVQIPAAAAWTFARGVEFKAGAGRGVR